MVPPIDEAAHLLADLGDHIAWDVAVQIARTLGTMEVARIIIVHREVVIDGHCKMNAQG